MVPLRRAAGPLCLRSDRGSVITRVAGSSCLRYEGVVLPMTLKDLNLATAERRLCVAALAQAGNIVGAAQLLGITRHALKRRIIKLEIQWTRTQATEPESSK